MRHFIVAQPSFIANQLVAAGSRVTEYDLGLSEPGEQLIEVDERGSPLNPADVNRLIGIDVNLAPVQVAPVAPHAPNPTRAQALPPQPAGGVSLAGDRRYVPADGVESNEAADARVERLKRELAQAEELLAAAGTASGDGPVAPTRRSAQADPVEPGPLDQSIPDLEKHLATINDPAELERLRTAEVSGKSRTGAIAAIDARSEELNP